MSNPESHISTLSFEGCNYLRQRLLLATLSGKSITIKNIRSTDDDPGLQEYEANLLRLIDTITNGSIIEINETGTRLFYQPGLLYGGKFEHECNLHRGIGYYLEIIIGLAPFCKKPMDVTLKGVTNNQMDPSVDAIKYGSLPVLKHFLGIDEGLELKVISRGVPPGGGGAIHFTCPVRRQLRPVQLTEPGKIKRIRGVAYAVRISPVVSNRIVEATKGMLLQFIPDVYIYTDHYKGQKSGRSPGFGLCLVAETTEGCFLTADIASNASDSGKPPSVPEDLGKEGASLLFEEIYRGGYVDSNSQGLACLFMALGQKDVSKILTGPLSQYTIQFLRHLQDFFQITFKLSVASTDDEILEKGAKKILLTCVGVGYTNLNKSTF